MIKFYQRHSTASRFWMTSQRIRASFIQNHAHTHIPETREMISEEINFGGKNGKIFEQLPMNVAELSQKILDYREKFEMNTTIW